MPFRINYVSESSDGCGFAIRTTQEGTPSRIWIRASDAKSVGDGLVEKVGDVDDLLVDAKTEKDVFVFDSSGNGLLADYVRGLGFPTFGGSSLADRLERDRSFGLELMTAAKIKTPKTIAFTDFDEGIEFVKKNSDKRLVYKPSKQLGDLSPSHVSYDAEDLVEMLENIKTDVEIANPQFELQEFKKGIAFSTELWFQNGRHVPQLNNHTLERKELMNGDIGPSGGCLGNIVWFCDGCSVCDCVNKLVPFLEEEDFHGMCDLNVIVAEDGSGIYGLEFTPRFGYDASPTLLWSVSDRSISEFFLSAARGELGDFKPHDGFGGAVRVTIPPWPTERYHAEEGVPIRGLDKDWGKNAFGYNIRAKEGKLESAGAWGILLLFIDRGSTPHLALRDPLEAAKEVRVKNKQYRTDLTECFKKDLEELEALL